MPPIAGASIRKILDSRGSPTVEVGSRTGGVTGRAAAPSGASTGTHEPKALPEGGVDEAIRTFHESVEPGITGRDVSDQAGFDKALRAIDGTKNFARIGCNVATAVSLATAKTAAAVSGKPLFRYLGGRSRLSLPLPMGIVIGGGRHAVGGTTIQEFLVVSQGPTAAANVFTNARVHGLVRDALAKKLPDAALGRGDEGAWVAKLADEEALSVVVEAWHLASKQNGFPVRPDLEPAASQYYRAR